jgi:hypothetical protein
MFVIKVNTNAKQTNKTMDHDNEVLVDLERCLTLGKTEEVLDRLALNISHDWGMKKLELICAYGYADLTQIFVDRVTGLNLNPSNDTNMSCLMYAAVGRPVRKGTGKSWGQMAQCNYPAVVRILLQAGADPNWCRLNGRTALHAAALYGEHEIVSTLLEYKRVSELINTKDAHGSTPLFLVCTNSQVSEEEGNSVNLDTVKVLLRNKADPSITCGKAAMTPLAASIHHRAYWRIILLMTTVKDTIQEKVLQMVLANHFKEHGSLDIEMIRDLTKDTYQDLDFDAIFTKIDATKKQEFIDK